MPSSVGGDIDHALDDVAGFRPAIAAIGPHRIGVGEHAGDVDMDRRRAVDAGERSGIEDECRHVVLQIGADGGDGLHPHCEESAVLVEREFRLGDVVARLRVADRKASVRVLIHFTGRPVSFEA